MEQKNYDKIRLRLEQNDLYLSDEDIDDVISVYNREKKEAQNIGAFSERVNHNDRELAFQQQWIKENRMERGINMGNGILQDLFTFQRQRSNLKDIELEISKRERMIVATVIQWLGTNCGWSFLELSLKKCGYKITKINP